MQTLSLSRCFRFVGLCLVAMCAAHGSTASAQADDVATPSLQQIIARWQGCEAKVLSLDISWKEDQSRKYPAKPIVADPFAPEPAVRKKLHSFEYLRRLLIDGNRVRFEDDCPTWVSSKAGLVPRHHIAVDDGKTVTWLTKWPPTHENSLQVVVGEHGEMLDWMKSMTEHYARLEHYRPSLRLVDFVKKGRVDDVPRSIGDDKCIVVAVTRDHPGGSTDYSYWLNPAQDFAIRRVTASNGDFIHIQHDREYQRSEEYGWLLKSWKIVISELNGELDNSFSGEILKTRINFEPQDSEFTLDKEN